MQRLAAERQRGAGLRAEQAGLGLEAGAVGGVAQDRVADMGQMHPDLVGAAGFQGAGEQAGDRLAVAGRQSFQHLPMGDGRAAAFAHGALVAGMRMAVERGVDGAFRPVGRAPDEGEIAALERPSRPVVGELLA